MARLEYWGGGTCHFQPSAFKVVFVLARRGKGLEVLGMDANVFVQGLAGSDFGWFYQKSPWWTAFGYVGNVLFSSRFILQWLYSERRKQLVVPPVFWHLSFWGSLVSLVYAFHVNEPPFILSFLFLPLLYGRNLALLYRRKGT